MPDDIAAEFANADLGDPRCAKRLPKLAASLAQAPSESISAACGGWSEVIGTFRFLNNGKFEAGELIRPHRRMVVERSDGHDCGVAIQDTTEMDFTLMKTVTDLGPLNDDTRRGFYMHGHYVVSEHGLPLGVLVDEKKGAPTRLFDAMHAAPLLGEIEFDVAAKTGGKKITNYRHHRQTGRSPRAQERWRSGTASDLAGGVSRVRDFACVWRAIHEE